MHRTIYRVRLVAVAVIAGFSGILFVFVDQVKSDADAQSIATAVVATVFFSRTPALAFVHLPPNFVCCFRSLLLFAASAVYFTLTRYAESNRPGIEVRQSPASCFLPRSCELHNDMYFNSARGTR
jgi:hypothetical protein